MTTIEKLEHIHFVLQECERVLGDDSPVDLEFAIDILESVRELFFTDN